MTKAVRAANSADAEAIRVLVNEAFELERSLKRGGAPRLAADGKELNELLTRGTFLLKEASGALQACIYVEPRDQSCYVGLLSVARDQRGHGLGRYMMEAAEAFAQEKGCRRMELSVVSPRRDTLVPLYEHLGYAESGTKPYPPALASLMLSPGWFVQMQKEI